MHHEFVDRVLAASSWVLASGPSLQPKSCVQLYAGYLTLGILEMRQELLDTAELSVIPAVLRPRHELVIDDIELARLAAESVESAVDPVKLHHRPRGVVELLKAHVHGVLIVRRDVGHCRPGVAQLLETAGVRRIPRR